MKPRVTSASRIDVKLEAALQAFDRSVAAAPRPGAARMRERVRRWWHVRRYRRALARLDHVLDDDKIRMAEHSAAALLAVLTERVARLDRASAPDVAAAIEIATRVRDEYQSYVARIGTFRDSAQAQVDAWRTNVEKAEHAAREDLAAQARERVDVWEQRTRKASEACERCATARHRLDDALAELHALAARSD